MRMQVADLERHPQAHRVPAMRASEMDELVADIRERGVRVPLEVIPGSNVVIDGRSRLAAAKAAKLDDVPVIEAPIEDGEDPVVYMLRAATRRRHLTDDQRACLAEEEREYLAEKSKKAQRSKAGKKGGKARHGKKSDGEAPPAPPTERARSKAAKSHNVSERRVRNASTVKKADPDEFEAVKRGDKTLAQAKREVERTAKRKELETKAKTAAKSRSSKKKAADWEIVLGDCVDELAKIEAGSVRLVFADPPYNIGVDYGDGAKADRLPGSQYLLWVSEWLEECKRVLSPDGSLWVMIGDEYAAEYAVELKELGFHVRSWVKWYETFGVNCKINFNRCSRHLFYCVKNKKRFVFHPDAVNRPSDRQQKYGDKRADPNGKIWDDVWTIPRLVGTAKERIPDFPTQVPLEITRAIVGCSSDPGDLVVDPFSGSASTGVAAVELGRRFVGIEKAEKFVALSILRMRGAA